MTEEFERLFAQVRSFGWDESKRLRVLQERGLDFVAMPAVFDEPTIAERSDRQGEERYKVYGFLGDLELVVVCTIRGDVCWIITARRARKDERKKYHDRLARRPTSVGED